MSKIASMPMRTDILGWNVFQADGQTDVSVSNYPSGYTDRIAVEGGAVRCTVSDTDAIVWSGKRTELVSSPASATGEYWYSWEFMVPRWNYSKALTVAQVHETSDAGDPDHAVLMILCVEGEEIFCRIPAAVLPANNTASVEVARQTFAYDVWHSMCVHMNYQTTAIGMREAFMDGVPMFRQFNVSTAYVDVLGPHFKLGVYDFYGFGDFGTKSAYYRNAGVWSGSAGYAEVMGSPPTTGQRLIQV